MENKKAFRRRNYFIKKKFQIDFSIKFLIIIVIEAVLAIGLFLYISKGTLTTGYLGSELKIAGTSDFFLPMLLFSNLIIVGATGIIGIAALIFLSHRLAGPLYRFEKTLADLSKGNLAQRFKLREKDQFMELQNSINELANVMDMNVGAIKSGIAGILKLVSEMQAAAASNPSVKEDMVSRFMEISKKLQELKETADYFETSSRQS